MEDEFVFPMKKELLIAAVRGDVKKVIKITTEGNIPINQYLGEETRKPAGLYPIPTVLTIAAENGNYDLVHKVLELGRDLYTTGVKKYLLSESTHLSVDYFGAMVVASAARHFNILQLLAEWRLFKLCEGDRHYVKLAVTAKQHNFERLECLLNSMENKSVVLKGWKGHSLMSLFILHGCPVSCIQTFIDHGITLNGWDRNGLTPLMCAILSGSLEYVQFLLEKGADPFWPHFLGMSRFQADGSIFDRWRKELFAKSTKDSYVVDLSAVGITALLMAASVKNAPILKMINEVAPEKAGLVEINQFSYLITPLIHAIEYGNLESVHLILENEVARKGADYHPLNSAIVFGKTDIFNLLLASDIKWDPDDLSIAASSCISTHNPQYLSKMLKSFDKEFHQYDNAVHALFSAIKCDSYECIHVLFEHSSFSADAKSRSGKTGLMFACECNKPEFVKLLLKKGANFKGELNPVIHAVCGNSAECLELMIDAGADLDFKSPFCGALSTAFTCALRGDGRCLEALLKSGKLVDSDGLKPVHKESCLGHPLDEIPVKNIILSMKYNVFQWEWCPVVGVLSLRNIAYAALTYGISPGKFIYNNQQVSPLIFAFFLNDITTVQYLLANRYFLPEDLQFLSNNAAFRKFIMQVDSPELSFLFEQLTCQPITLQTWSFLTISKRLSRSVSEERAYQVDSLPLPRALKDKLKFKTNISQLRQEEWKNLLTPRGYGRNLRML